MQLVATTSLHIMSMRGNVLLEAFEKANGVLQKLALLRSRTLLSLTIEDTTHLEK